MRRTAIVLAVTAVMLGRAPALAGLVRENCASVFLLRSAVGPDADRHPVGASRVERFARGGDHWRSALLAWQAGQSDGHQRFTAAIDGLSAVERDRPLDVALTLAAQRGSPEGWRGAVLRVAAERGHQSPVGYLRLGRAEVAAITGQDARPAEHAARALRLAGEAAAEGYVPSITRAMAWYELAQLARPRDRREAIDAYSRAIAADPEDASFGYAWMSAYELAHIHIDEARWDEAQSLLSYAEGLPDRYHRRSYSRMGLARVAVGQQRADRALALLRRAIADDPLFVPLYVRLGALLQESGDHAQAAEQYRRALEIDPANAEARQALVKSSG